MRLDPYAADHDGYQRLLAWTVHLMNGPLDRSLVHLVEVRVSQINGCAFCLAMHTDQARKEGVAQSKLDTVAAWRETEAFTAEERAALALAESLTRLEPAGVADEVWDAAAEHFDEKALTTLVEVIAMINAFNRINVATRYPAEHYRPNGRRGNPATRQPGNQFVGTKRRRRGADRQVGGRADSRRWSS